MTVATLTPAQQAVIDAWAAMKPWVEGTLPNLAQGQSLPTETQDLGDIGACNALNVPGNMSGAIWGSDGDATIVLTSLAISTMSGVQIQPAEFVDGTTVHLPLSFSKLEVQGNYAYVQPCALYDLGKKVSHTTTNGKGTIDETISNSSLYYVATFNGQLTLTGVTVNGSPDVQVHPDDGGLPSWLAKIADFLSTFHEADVLKGTLQNVFLTADFSKAMIVMLNQKVGGGS